MSDEMILSPAVAAARYIAAGCVGAHGLPTRAEFVALLALTPAERLAWAREVADAFAAQMPVGSDGTPHVIEDYQDVGSVVWVAADFLTETSRRQPWAGQCYWLVDDVPDVPHVLSVDDHGDWLCRGDSLRDALRARTRRDGR